MSPHGSEREICHLPTNMMLTSKTFVISFIYIFTIILCMLSFKSSVLNLFNPSELFCLNILSQHGFEVQQLLGGEVLLLELLRLQWCGSSVEAAVLRLQC